MESSWSESIGDGKPLFLGSTKSELRYLLQSMQSQMERDGTPASRIGRQSMFVAAVLNICRMYAVNFQQTTPRFPADVDDKDMRDIYAARNSMDCPELSSATGFEGGPNLWTMWEDD